MSKQTKEKNVKLNNDYFNEQGVTTSQFKACCAKCGYVGPWEFRLNAPHDEFMSHKCTSTKELTYN